MWTIAKKEFRLLIRDRRAGLILLVMPLIFILILGLLLGETFGQKPDDRQRVSIVDLDQGTAVEQALAWFAVLPTNFDAGVVSAATFTLAQQNRFPEMPWSKLVQTDLRETASIRLEVIENLEQAEALIRDHKRAAVVVFKPGFSRRVAQCSFLVDGINPFHRDGVYLDQPGRPPVLEVELLKDSKQPGEAAIIEQIAQVTLLRVVLPWMIGRAFERLSDPEFIDILGDKVNLPVPKAWRLLVRSDRLSLNRMLSMAAAGDPAEAQLYKNKVGGGVQEALKEQFKKYDLRGKTWAALTKSLETRSGPGAEVSAYVDISGTGVFNRGAARYQLLVPSYTVMFAFFLVLTMGWLFVSERRQGTLKRLRSAPVTRGEILAGKLLPCFVLSLSQEIFLLVAGKLVFGLRWGPDSWSLGEQVLWLLPVMFTTSLAAMGLALLVSALARTEVQVALYGALPVLVLALVGGCVLPREMMPEHAQELSLLTPHGWALNAYRELLDPNPNSNPNLRIVLQACGALAGYGAAFFALAWRFLRLD